MRSKRSRRIRWRSGWKTSSPLKFVKVTGYEGSQGRFPELLARFPQRASCQRKRVGVSWNNCLSGSARPIWRLQDAGQRYTILPFKLHQFISQTGSVYTTLDQDENRFITLEPGVFKNDEAAKKPIFPNVFSRASGHAFICVSRVGDQLEPREFRDSSDDDAESTDGYLIVGDDIWDEADDRELLPESWLRSQDRTHAALGKESDVLPHQAQLRRVGQLL